MPITTFTRTLRHPDQHITDTLTQTVEYDTVMRHARVPGFDGTESTSLEEIIQHLDSRHTQWVEHLSNSRDLYATFATGLIDKGFQITKVESDF